MCHPQNALRKVFAIAMSIISFATATGAELPAVSVQEDAQSFTLTNGRITARVLKRTGDLRSLKYNGLELFTDRSGHPGGYWSHDTSGGKGLVAKVTIDPASNNGERAEVSVKGISGGIKMGHGPGAGCCDWRSAVRERVRSA